MLEEKLKMPKNIAFLSKKVVINWKNIHKQHIMEVSIPKPKKLTLTCQNVWVNNLFGDQHTFVYIDTEFIYFENWCILRIDLFWKKDFFLLKLSKCERFYSTTLCHTECKCTMYPLYFTKSFFHPKFKTFSSKHSYHFVQNRIFGFG